MALFNLVLLSSVVFAVLCKIDEFSAGEDGMNWEFASADSTSRSEAPDLVQKDIPILVWWTRDLYPHWEPFKEKSCPAGHCYVTKNKTFANHSQTVAFYFYGTDYFVNKILPLPRKHYHLWGVAHEESPLNNFILDHAVGMSVFNYTATYHRSADFPLSLISFPSESFILDRQPVSVATKNVYQKTRGYAPAVYVQSHCEVPSDRDRYVEELMQYIKVDSYGKCLHNKDLPEHLVAPVENMFHTEFKNLLANYKFVLSFENGICDDYMTEKLFRPLHVGSVPVYKGSPLARDFMPDNHSIIMVDDFASPKQLAEFLHKLNDNDELYESYLDFKRRKTITNPSLLEAIKRRPWRFTDMDINYGPFLEDFECYLCGKATEVYNNMKDREKDPSVPPIKPKITDGRKFACRPPEPYKEPDQLDWWFIYDYTNRFWDGLDTARAIRDMLLANEGDNSKFPDYLKKYKKRPIV